MSVPYCTPPHLRLGDEYEPGLVVDHDDLRLQVRVEARVVHEAAHAPGLARRVDAEGEEDTF